MNKNSGALSDNDFKTLRSFDTPTICNVIELFEYQPQSVGYMDGRIRCCFPKMKPMVGFASTATTRLAAPSLGKSGYEMLPQQFEAFAEIPSPAVVVFQDLDDPPVAATFGEIMCSSYQAFGAAGLITSGAGRDLDQVEALDFPVFTGCTICSHAYPSIVEIHTPIRVGGLIVRPGDLIHADLNGVATIPIEIAADVARVCQEFVDTEEIIMKYLRSTKKPNVDEYKKVFKESADLRNKMKQRLSHAGK